MAADQPSQIRGKILANWHDTAPRQPFEPLFKQSLILRQSRTTSRRREWDLRPIVRSGAEQRDNPYSGQEPLRAAGRWGARKGHPKMTDKQEKPPAATDEVVRRLVDKTGITDAQARELVAFLGPNNWTSLLREARILKPKGPKAV
ncbi:MULTISPECIES: hypothetical protein [unclassified Mesorhizobium]|uniref:hypothetical protein n=2 Tax=unclassified Mesorhizobium TaxID=325217 RepID=UPI00163D7598|nr:MULTISPECIES: hypothetical protein [unclassified Mesorhizobium]